MGEKRNGRKSFHVGKDVLTDGHTSFEGPPNTNLDTYDKTTGRFLQRRKYGKDGYATKDYDVGNQHKNRDHVHDVSREVGRSVNDRDPNKAEQREINKAKRKRRFWND